MARISELTEHCSHDPAFKEGYERAKSDIRIGMALRDLREARGLTQAEVARRAKLDQSDISRIENGRWGKRGISHETLERILPVLGLRISRTLKPSPGTELTPAAARAIEDMTKVLSWN